MIAFITKLGASGNNIKVEVELRDTDLTGIGPVNIDLPLASVNSGDDIKSLLPTALNTFCTTNSVTVPSSIIWLTNAGTVSPSGLSNAPQGSIANAPADATTNYNTVTTLLGSLTGAVNTANAKQNDIATKLNTLLSELRTLGLISA